MTLESERNVRISRRKCDLWDEHNFSLVLARSMFGLDDVVGQAADKKPSSIAKSVLGIQVSKADYDASFFKPLKKYKRTYNYNKKLLA